MEGYSYLDLLDNAEKTQLKATCIMDENDSPMKYKSNNGHLVNKFYYVDPILDCDDLKNRDLCFYDYIRDDEEMSEIENNENAFSFYLENNFV